jgi:hypothetical protein
MVKSINFANARNIWKHINFRKNADILLKIYSARLFKNKLNNCFGCDKYDKIALKIIIYRFIFIVII